MKMKIVLFFIALLIFAPISKATIIGVGKQKAFTQIKQAIAAAQAGDTVLVESGLYKEGNIVINKKIFFLGNNLPILDGEHKFEILSIKADSVTVKGFRVQHSGYATLDDPGGIKVYDSNFVTISENDLYDNFFGIYIQYGTHCVVKNNTIVAFGKDEQQIGNGIHCWKSDSLQIIGNHVSGHRDGIYFEFVTHSVIWRNISFDNLRYGLHFMFSNNDAYFTNLFKNNRY